MFAHVKMTSGDNGRISALDSYQQIKQATRMTNTPSSFDELEPVDRTSVVDSVIERLEGLIFGLEPGEALPSEGKLAEALAVSRLTVREATRTLEARGLLEISQGRRPTVAAPNGSLVGDFFEIAVRRDQIGRASCRERV